VVYLACAPAKSMLQWQRGCLCALANAAHPVTMQGLQILPFPALLSDKLRYLQLRRCRLCEGVPMSCAAICCMFGIQVAGLLEGG
jgi:hypothetical protein